MTVYLRNIVQKTVIAVGGFSSDIPIKHLQEVWYCLLVKVVRNDLIFPAWPDSSLVTHNTMSAGVSLAVFPNSEVTPRRLKTINWQIRQCRVENSRSVGDMPLRPPSFQSNVIVMMEAAVTFEALGRYNCWTRRYDKKNWSFRIAVAISYSGNHFDPYWFFASVDRWTCKTTICHYTGVRMPPFTLPCFQLSVSFLVAPCTDVQRLCAFRLFRMRCAIRITFFRRGSDNIIWCKCKVSLYIINHHCITTFLSGE